ncbi:hypothetical protein M514_09165 [Trichuris suis]|uniref:Uncharacterized protein n=1 Tax=Trichuris suis TaxID=68888 RepID=A0A085MZR1_9BILA|nr:hypothetical protein M513_09165 [Trichuris suis]KFD62707.1 hypothetical protein M514_09165 [Trichuris suis]
MAIAVKLLHSAAPHILACIFAASIVYHALNGAFSIWTSFFLSTALQMLVALCAPNAKASRMFRTLNSLTIVSGFLWLVFLFWSTREFCFSPLGVSDYAPVTNEVLLMSVSVLWCCMVQIPGVKRTLIRRYLRNFLLIVISTISTGIFLWALACKWPYALIGKANLNHVPLGNS